MKKTAPKPITLDSLDDSLLDKRLKEINELKDENSKLRLKLSHTESAKEEWNKKFNDLASRYNKLSLEKDDLEKKLLYYEHDPFIMDDCDDGIDILYWDENEGSYELFASFIHNSLEEDLEEFCKDFLLTLKDTYLVE